MPGNELRICEFLFSNLSKIELPYLGIISVLGAPSKQPGAYFAITSEEELTSISTDSSGKKADIYLNGIGVSLKQEGSSFSFNRIQRKNIPNLLNELDIENSCDIVSSIDKEIKDFHEGKISPRNRNWINFFSENEFYRLLEYLMMFGSPILKASSHPATYILEAPKSDIKLDNIKIYDFQSYFEQYLNSFYISIRRSWIGQGSNSEHGRAKGIAKDDDNKPWVFRSISGTPRSGWRQNFPISKRRTVYYLMIEKSDN